MLTWRHQWTAKSLMRMTHVQKSMNIGKLPENYQKMHLSQKKTTRKLITKLSNEHHDNYWKTYNQVI